MVVFNTIHNWFKNYHGEINNKPSLVVEDEDVLSMDDYFRLYGLSNVDARPYIEDDNSDFDVDVSYSDNFDNYTYYKNQYEEGLKKGDIPVIDKKTSSPSSASNSDTITANSDNQTNKETVANSSNEACEVASN